MKTRILAACIGASLASLGAASLGACDTADPTEAIVDNGYPAPGDAADVVDQVVVYKTWWVVSLFADPVAAGQSSDVNRIVPANDYAYALLAPGWDPTSSSPPSTLIPVRSKTKLGAARGDTLHIAVSDVTFDGNCAAGSQLAPADAELIVESVFPGEFAGVTYDPRTCAIAPIADDAGSPRRGSRARDGLAEAAKRGFTEGLDRGRPSPP